jgi:CheY-like chemotaxis protein
MKELLDLILFIDDDEGTNFLHQRFTTRANCTRHIKTMTSAVDALAYLKDTKNPDYIRPNIIFLDINMPVMNGWDFLEEYNELDEKYQSDIILVMLTTSLNPSDKERAKQLQIVSDFKNKPLTTETLLELIKEKFPERF